MIRLASEQKPLKLLAFYVLLFSLVAPIFFFQPASASSYIEKTFEWDYDGQHWTWTLNIPTILYDAYQEVPESTRDANGLEGYGFLTTTKDTYVKMLAERLNETAINEGYGSFDQVSFVLAFVQSLPYTSDSVTTGYDNYPRFPVETLVDDGGDCEDTAILFATITLILGYDTVYINPEGHLAVGVLGNDLDGSYYTYNNKTYYYCETTGDGWTIGELPDEWAAETAYIYSINTNQQFIPDVIITTPTPSPRSTASTTPRVTVQPTVAPPTSNPNSVDDAFAENTVVIFFIVIAVVLAVVIVAVSTKRKKQPAQMQTYVPSGSPVPPPPPPPPNQAAKERFCVYCGASNSIQAVYCGACGKSFS
ncbi:MAG TPA: hypothetical protein VLH35_00005 [Candidatus Acidoferrales bacterium]|nr:hypothetical protein [Candidatus Acidoferrales bacterium]